MRPVRFVLCLAAGLAVAACTNRGDDSGATIQTLEALRGIGAGVISGDATPAPPPVTRAVLNTLEGEFLEAEIERSGARAYLFVSAERTGAAAGDEGGRLLVWRSENDVSLTLRDGVLVATRGLGEDMVSASGGPALTAVRAKRAGQGGKRQVYSALDNKPVEMNFACAVDDLGETTIVIVERRHPTRHLRETCELKGGTIVNDYWVDSRGATVWQSRQWSGPNIGYVTMRQLTP